MYTILSQIKICRDLRTFWRTFGKKSAFLGQEGQEVHYYMVYIAYSTELNLQIYDYAQKRCFCRENCKYALDENFHGHFCPRRKAAKFCYPDVNYNVCFCAFDESVCVRLGPGATITITNTLSDQVRTKQVSIARLSLWVNRNSR